MSCSKDSTVADMMKKGIVGGDMKIEGVPSTKTFDYIDSVTNLAKTKYSVDMGSLFQVKFKEIPKGLTGSRSYAYLIPNEEAFEAIDRSKAMQKMEYQKELQAEQKKALQNQRREYENLQAEGNYTVQDGEVVPAVFNTGNLPKINITC